MVSKKIFSSREQQVMGKSIGGYIRTSDGIIKLMLRCNGADYRQHSIDIANKIINLLQSERFLFEDQHEDH